MILAGQQVDSEFLCSMWIQLSQGGFEAERGFGGNVIVFFAVHEANLGGVANLGEDYRDR